MEAVQKERQPGRLHAMPVGIPVCKFVDPDDERNVYQTCPCSNAQPCLPCPLVGRKTVSETKRGQLPPIAVGIPHLLHNAKDVPSRAIRTAPCCLPVSTLIASVNDGTLARKFLSAKIAQMGVSRVSAENIRGATKDSIAVSLNMSSKWLRARWLLFLTRCWTTQWRRLRS